MSLLSVNESPLAFWKASGFTDTKIYDVCATLNDYLVLRIECDSVGESRVTASHKVGETRQGHSPSIGSMMKQILKKWGPFPHSGALVFWLEDGIWDLPFTTEIPLFCFGREKLDNHTLLIPDPAFLESKGYEAELNAPENAIPWSQRASSLFWRGASSGLGGYKDKWQEAPRARLVLASKRLNDPSILDAAFTKIVEYPGEPSAREILEQNLVTPPVPLSEFYNYKFLVEVDGEYCPWRSLFIKLGSGSVVLRVQSSREQWYYRDLIPWVHYIPLRQDLSDLEERITWIRKNDGMCEVIAQNARAFIKSLSYERTLEELRELFGTLLSFRRN